MTSSYGSIFCMYFEPTEYFNRNSKALSNTSKMLYHCILLSQNTQMNCHGKQLYSTRNCCSDLVHTIIIVCMQAHNLVKFHLVDIESRSIRKRSRPSTETISASKKQNTSVDNNAELDDAEIYSVHSDEFEINAVCTSALMKKTSCNKQGYMCWSCRSPVHALKYKCLSSGCTCTEPLSV